MCDKKRFLELEEKFKQLEKKQDKVVKSVSELESKAELFITLFKSEMAEIKRVVTEHNESSKEIVDAWKTAGGVSRFVRWLSRIILACGIIGAFIYQVLTWKIGG